MKERMGRVRQIGRIGLVVLCEIGLAELDPKLIVRV